MPIPSVESLHALTEGAGAEVLATAMPMQNPGPGDVSRLRKLVSADVAAAALEVAAARRSLRGRVEAWQTYWADREGAAQASDDASASWKAARFAGVDAAIDLCCGTGADLRAMARVTSARGVDLRPERAWMAARNANAPTLSADVVKLAFDERFVHVDPARRDEVSGRRRHAWDDLAPAPSFLRSLVDRSDGVMVKLGPGVELPPTERPAGSELAFLSRGRFLTQAVLCSGALARHAGRNVAVLLDHAMECAGPPTWSPTGGDANWPACGVWRRWIAEPDPSLERSGLLAAQAKVEALAERAPGLGLCTRDEAPDGASPWFRWFERVESGAARLDHLQRRLRELGAGEVHVKVRGAAADADAWSQALRGEGTQPFVVFVHRLGQGAEAVIARRPVPDPVDTRRRN